ncbi:MAG: nucleotide exchange factor GrpE [Hyphomicrobiales bacterium]|nr:nucleotide exchange factor GrpE [Hyphomicrobiales bacterium]
MPVSHDGMIMDDSDKKHPDTPAEDQPDAQAAPKEESGAAEAKAMSDETPWAGGAEAAEEAAAEDALAALQAENDKLKDQHLRALAEMENLRQRTAREVREARAYAIANFARDVLAVGDNLRRAIEAVPRAERAAADPALAALHEGVEMTERELQNMLEKHQVRRIDPKGERFDPHFHQAMFEVPNEEVASGTVVEVVQAGYVIGERVLRPAMVGVSKGGPKPAAATASEAEAPAEAAETAEGSVNANDNKPGAATDKGA